jgi:hypothetical protein
VTINTCFGIAGQLFEEAGLVPDMKTVTGYTKALSFKKPLAGAAAQAATSSLSATVALAGVFVGLSTELPDLYPSTPVAETNTVLYDSCSMTMRLPGACLSFRQSW